MSCNNCFNGCAETISDQCVKYTGIDVPALGISTGDNLLAVENAIVNFLVPAINGTGIKPIIDPDIICDIVKSYLPACTTCTGFTLNEILTAIVKTVCDLQTQIDVIDATLDILNAPYKIGCLSGVTTSSETHDILQATIDNLCSLNSAFSILTNELHTLYSSNGTELNNYITNFLATQTSANLASARMVPFSPIPYYGALSGYPAVGDSLSLTGPGVGYWKNIYLCNGLNGTPDLRGRVPVGTTTMGNNAFPSQTDPCGSCTTCGNPTYALGDVDGSNCVTLGLTQLPNHTHPNTAIATADPHNHFTTSDYIQPSATALTATNYVTKQSTTSYAYYLRGFSLAPTLGLTSDATENITVTMTNGATGQGDAHPNIQPVIALHYIMYIP